MTIIFENQKLLNGLSSIPEIRNQSRAGFYKGLLHTKNDYVRTIQTGTRSGRPFRIRYRGQILTGRHSAPGENIANVTGRTARLAYARISGDDGIIGSKAPYSGYPEYGTKKIVPRKTAQKIVDKNINFISQNIEKSILE